MTPRKPWRMHPQAERELDRAAGRYDKQRAGLGAELLDEFDAAYAAVRRGPITDAMRSFQLAQTRPTELHVDARATSPETIDRLERILRSRS